jgi:hypothetical protein
MEEATQSPQGMTYIQYSSGRLDESVPAPPGPASLTRPVGAEANSTVARSWSASFKAPDL